MLEAFGNLLIITGFVLLVLFIGSIAFFVAIAITCAVEEWHEKWKARREGNKAVKWDE